MDVQVAIITSEFLKDYVQQLLRDFFMEDTCVVYSYGTFQDLKHIYRNIPAHIRGVVVSGSFPAQVIRLGFPDTTRLIREFNNDDLGLYKLFFSLLHEHRNLDLKRVYADVLDVGGIDPEQYLLKPFKEPIADVHMQAAKGVDIEGLTKIEKMVAQRHIEKWKNGEIDVSITRFSSIMHQLEKAGLPVYFAYPDREYVKNIILSTMQELTISSLQGSMPGCLFVTLKKEKDTNAQELGGGEDFEKSSRQTLLARTLKNYCALYDMDAILQKKQRGFEIVTQHKFIALATDNFKTCSLQKYLKTVPNLQAHIGYGLGSSLYQARINALDANGEASKYPRSFSCLINEKDQLISPLSCEGDAYTAPVVLSGVDGFVRRLSKTTGLSTLNIQKLISIMESIPDKQITSQKLAHKLQITRRSANRLLVTLKNAGQARVVNQNQGINCGRPEHVYEIDLGL